MSTLLVTCWCEARYLHVRVDDIAAGRTRSCGGEGCADSREAPEPTEPDRPALEQRGPGRRPRYCVCGHRISAHRAARVYSRGRISARSCRRCPCLDLDIDDEAAA